MKMVVEVELGVVRLELEEASAAEIDGKLALAIAEKQRDAFIAAAEQLDVANSTTKLCPECAQKMTSCGRPARRVGMLAGPVLVKRRRLRCTSCGFQIFPLDAVLGIDGKHTLPVVERALYLATELSYAKASRALERLTGAKVSHGQIQALAKREGALVGGELDQATAELFGLGLDPGERVARTRDDTVVVAIDGGAIPDRATGDDFEAKVGVIYGVRAEVSRGRFRLLDRVGYASLEDCTAFGQKLACLAHMQGATSAGRVLAIGDGAIWIRHLVRDYFPGAIYLLDLYHLKKRIREVLHEDGDEALREKIHAACLAGSAEDALGLLGQLKPQTADQAEKLRKLKGYIRSNKLGIANYARTDLFGSGAVEKAVDLLVSRRFKTRGMSWFRPGAAGMLALRLLRFNGDWDDHWHWRMNNTPMPAH